MLPYNDVAAVEAAFAGDGPADRRGHHRGGAAATWAWSRPATGSTAGSPRSRTAHGALLILDEVMTGFRVRRGGWAGLEPVDADLYTFGKVMGGGLPAAAFGGRAEIMAQLAPAGPVYQAGTLSGNPLACAAGLATLRLATAEVYAQLDATAATIGELAVGRAGRRGGAAPLSTRRQHVLDLLHRRRRCRLRRRAQPRTSRRSGRSSTRCWPAGSTCRRARTRRGSSPPRSTTRRWSVIAAALPHAGPRRGRSGWTA